jgi:hypothetical protein
VSGRRYQVVLHDDHGYCRTISYKYLTSACEGFDRVAKHGMFMFAIVRQAWLVDREGAEDTLSLYPGTLDYWKDPLWKQDGP